MDDQVIMQMAQNISSIQTSLTDFRREMLGNGQPGRIQILEKSVATTKKELAALSEIHAYWNGSQTRWSAYVSVGVTAGLTAVWELVRYHFGWFGK